MDPRALGDRPVAYGASEHALRLRPQRFVNYAPRLIDGRYFSIFGDLGLSLGAARAETSATWDTDRGGTRLLSSATFDDRKHLRSAAVGDSLVSAGPLGGSLLIGGVSIARNFGLDPYLVKIPRLGYTGSAMAPSTLDVYVNDILVRRVPVQPGQFDLANIVPSAGAGVTRYVLRDATARSNAWSRDTTHPPACSPKGSRSMRTASVSCARSTAFEASATVSRHHRSLSTRRHRQARAGRASRVRSFGPQCGFGAHTGRFVRGARAAYGRERHGRGRGATRRRRHRELRVSPRGSFVRSLLRGATPEFRRESAAGARRSLFEQVTTTSHSLGSRASLATEVSFASRRDAGMALRLAITQNTRSRAGSRCRSGHRA